MADGFAAKRHGHRRLLGASAYRVEASGRCIC